MILYSSPLLKYWSLGQELYSGYREAGGDLFLQPSLPARNEPLMEPDPRTAAAKVLTVPTACRGKEDMHLAVTEGQMEIRAEQRTWPPLGLV